MQALAILPIGKVNLKNGKNKMFGQVWDCWAEDPTEHNMLVQLNDKQIVVHTSGEGDPVGFNAEFKHDQTRRNYGRGNVIAVQPHTKQGLLLIAEAAENHVLTMATYK